MKRALAVIVLAIATGATPSGAAPTPSLSAVLDAHDWINAQPRAASLAGKVVLVDVFTFGCSNCKSVTPNLRALHRSKRGDLVILGIHTPETAYERERSNVVEQLKAQGIVWPVAVDNDMALWNAYGIEYWPTQLIFDRRGRLRATIIGDSQDVLVDATIDKLIDE
jgi:thiol-disulfide isomerase/thioredoxin